jgi:tRNA A-37 threonylcarbamoyl transferase component Bud32
VLPGLHEIVATDDGTARSAVLELEGPVFDGRFRVESRIAEGGFAVVYKAWQLALERRVALKVLKPPRNQDATGRAEFRERFAAEARTIARLRHPDIVDVYDFSVATLASGELAPWMALEWLDGESLALDLGRRRRAGARGRDPAAAVAFLRPVMRALAHAHAAGIVHRDIKPSNIMVTATPNGPSLRVLDFGIAKIMVDGHPPGTGTTRTESLPAFSPGYAAPEQVAFSRTGPWTDVHALGLLLTEVMTDAPPFSEADPDTHFFEQVMAVRRPTPASQGRDVGPFEPVLARAVALSPRDRWRNAAELLAALDRVVQDVQGGGGGGLPASAAIPVPTSTFTPPLVAPEALEARDTAARPESGRRQPAFGARGARAGLPRRSTGVVAIVAALLAAGATWIGSRRAGAPPTPTSRSRLPELTATTTPATRAASPEPLPGPEDGAGPRRDEGQPSAIRATRVAPAPPPSPRASQASRRRRPRVAPENLNLGDGRDLFNDTK